jgi:sulfite reductase beta subunit-like hemoprotein
LFVSKDGFDVGYSLGIFSNMASHDEEVKRIRIIPDIHSLAAAGFDKIAKDDMTRLKWVGFYKQKQAPYFMVRVKISGGIITLDQLAAVSRMAMEMGNGVDHLSTRQDIELHGVLINAAPKLLKDLTKVGLTTKGSCGDTVRNICGVPCAGVCPSEVYNVEALRQYLYDHFLADDSVLNLPRKFKIALSGCLCHSGQYSINDVGMFPSRNAARVAAEGPGFEFWVGGGLGAQPMLATKLADYIPASEIPAACAATVETHRLYGNRDSRSHARLKFVLKKWGIEKYKAAWQAHFEEYVEKLGRPQFDLKSQPTELWQPALGAPFYKQKKTGQYGVEVMVPLGDARAEDMLSFVNFCRKHNAQVRITQGQNLHVQNLTEAAARELPTLVEYYGWSLQDAELAPNVVACPGLDECVKGLYYTKAPARQITQMLLSDSRSMPKGLTVHFSGCPNNCAQNSSAAIGFMSATRPGGWQKIGVFSLYLGGSLRESGALGKMVAAGLQPESLPRVIKGLVDAYYEDRKIAADSEKNTSEDFSTWARMLPKDRLVKILKAADCGAAGTQSAAPVAAAAGE